MSSALRHRGPDAFGSWLDQKSGIALGHRRLSIIDLTPSGEQPMLSLDRRFVLIFNGEIYNHSSLRKELISAGWHHPWRGTSDTETLIVALQVWGIELTLSKLNGMFAFALWDRKDNCLTLARDRIGEKPLYYGFARDTFLFASELKSLTLHPSWIGNISRNVLALYLRHAYVRSFCIYEGINA